MEWMFLPYKRYADFSGRSRRKEYWMFILFTVIVYAALVFLGGGLDTMDDPTAELIAVLLLLWLLLEPKLMLTLIPLVAAAPGFPSLPRMPFWL